MPNIVTRLSRQGTALAVVDIQERLLPAMFERDRLLRNAVQLVRGCAALRLPVVVTEQYPKGLGPTVAELAAVSPSFRPIEKTTFSACGVAAFARSLKSKGASRVILCGIESHVCVSQTCLDLLDQGFAVFVAADATSSRTEADWQCGIQRAREAGAIVVSVEMVLFEMLGGSDAPEFKQILEIVK